MCYLPLDSSVDRDSDNRKSTVLIKFLKYQPNSKLSLYNSN